MNRNCIWALFLTAMLALCLIMTQIGCGDDDDDDDDSSSSDDDNLDDIPGVDCDGDNCWISGVIDTDLTLTPDKNWILKGGVFIGNDVDETVLTIEAGTTVYGETSTNGMLVITRGSKIMANGTAEAPVVFTSSKEEGQRARGDWGGLIINGRAPINNCLSEEQSFCESIGEGGTGLFGGDDPEDDSGVLTYVRVEFAGRLISPDNELNGIAFQGVGSGGDFHHLQIHKNKDDGIEFFGGNANVKHVLVTGPADDMFDWTDGWTGKAQFIVLQQYSDIGDNGFECDNSGEDNTASPRSKPTISNATVIGGDSDYSDMGLLLREGTAGNLSNFIIYGWDESAIAIANNETYNNAWNWDNDALSGELTVTSSILFNNNDNFREDEFPQPFTVEDFFNTLNAGNSIEDPMLGDPRNEENPDFLPGSGSPALTGAAVPEDSFFDDVDFRGGVSPDDDWTKGWTTTAVN